MLPFALAPTLAVHDKMNISARNSLIAVSLLILLLIQGIWCIWNCPTGLIFEDIKLDDSYEVWSPPDLTKEPWTRNLSCSEGEYLTKLTISGKEVNGEIKFSIECGKVSQVSVEARDELVPDWDKTPGCRGRGPMIGYLMQWNDYGRVMSLYMECPAGEFLSVYQKSGQDPRRQLRKRCPDGAAICGYTELDQDTLPSITWFNPICCQLPPEYTNVTRPRIVTVSVPGGRGSHEFEVVGPWLSPDHHPHITSAYCSLPGRFPVHVKGERTFVNNTIQQFAMPCNTSPTDYQKQCAWSIVGFSYKRQSSGGAMVDIEFECDSGAWRTVENPFGESNLGESKRYKYRCSEGKAVCGYMRDGQHNQLNMLCCPLPENVTWDVCKAEKHFESITYEHEFQVGVYSRGADGVRTIDLGYDDNMFQERLSLYTRRVMEKVEGAVRDEYPNGLKNISLKNSMPGLGEWGRVYSTYQLRVSCGPYEFQFPKLLKFTDKEEPPCRKLRELGIHYCYCTPNTERPATCKF